MSYIDITVPMRSGMASFPGDPPVEFKQALDIKKDGVYVKLCCFGSHTGTHFDAPFHMIADGKKGDDIPADYFIGMAKVFSFMSGGDIGLVDIRGLDIGKDDIVLFKTPNSPHMLQDKFFYDYVTVTPDAARELVRMSVKAVGIDYLSIDKFGSSAVHDIFLGAVIPIIEGLDLSKTAPGIYMMSAMFMSIQSSDGAPLRAILHDIES